MKRLLILLSLLFAFLVAAPKVRADGTDGYVFNGTTYTLFNFPGSISTEPLAINDSGNIAGIYLDSSGNFHGFLDAGGTFTSIDDPGAGGTLVQGMNNLGQIVGTTTNNGSFLYSGGIFTSLPSQLNPFGINDQGQISGYYFDSSGVPHGFLLTGSTITTINNPNFGETFLFGINDSGEIVGQALTINGPEAGFLYNNGVFTTISCPGAIETLPFGINNNGAIVGDCESTQGISGFIDINGNFELLNVPTFGHTEADGINDSNHVVGDAADQAEMPEPSTLLLLTSGILSLLAFRLRRTMAR